MKTEYVLQSPFTHHVSKWHFQQFIEETSLKQFRNLLPDNYPKKKWIDILRERVEKSEVGYLHNQEQKWSYGYAQYKWNKDLSVRKPQKFK